MFDLQVLVRDNRADVDLLAQMHRLRRRVFAERLEWDVMVSGDMEIDNFDILAPTYLLLVAGTRDGGRELIGSVRCHPTTGPTMLSDTFPQLAGGQPMTRSPLVWEASRFCVDLERAEARLRTERRSGTGLATHALLAGMVEWGIGLGLRQVIAVTDIVVEGLVNRAGCRTRRLAPPMQVGKTKAVAVVGNTDAETLAAIRASGGLQEPVIREGSGAPARRRAA